jgi:hypothetical protein
MQYLETINNKESIQIRENGELKEIYNIRQCKNREQIALMQYLQQTANINENICIQEFEELSESGIIEKITETYLGSIYKMEFLTNK